MPRFKEIEDAFIDLKDAEAELTYANTQVKDLWKLVHKLVQATRNDKELNSPEVYQHYDKLCNRYGETPRQAKVLKDGRP